MSDQKRNDEVNEMDLSNVIEFPSAANTQFKRQIKTHLNNLFLSYGKERVLEYLMETEGLERARPPGLFKRAG